MTREFALRFVNAMVAGDLATVASMLAKDVVWHLPPFAKRPPVVGRDAVLNFAREAQATYYEVGTLRLEPALVVADSDGAVVLGTLRGRTIRGKDYENLYSFGLRFADGEVVEGWELVDSAHFLEQMR
jgi:ketosteroid isomerase-like protein